MEKENPKRLAPTRDTLRELYLKSGNRCAFPKCRKTIFNASGNFVGQVCHIEAAEPGGERFNKDQTNELRRGFDNLMLMCYEHHIETNKVDLYSVAAMKKMKKDHEALFSDVIGVMLFEVFDHTKLSNPLVPSTLQKINRVSGWGLTQGELNENLEELKKMIGGLSKIPEPSRKLFLILVERGEKDEFGTELVVEVSEIQQVTGLGKEELRSCFAILDKKGFTQDNGKTEFGIESVSVSTLRSGWCVWLDIKEFCMSQNTPLEDFIINLDFSSLD
ncbi:hypothetical protein AAY86_10595 [Pseudomonas amygdali pv. tabaci str. ATCC 11528]|uniref:hypothetical protein n=1 Tax=Pseudomonas amygdali TaxID=47877 RepID=UPI0001BC9592|nr:hypothetical protein [Pseudomonas amygdali]KEZ64708.1 hypothetical protein C1E_0225725 [Pseudomonas amygdali pv. tabaci str. ATCC 11528]KKY52957.1 hypothetical protein AAY86_10595 [Pseudomonas amygdali pv. tabaci str. ATCC 11528]QED85959.1 hypothetical protein PSYTB_20975 [Pseudomonas amygdali pv. tabaci str. ATCC 11528]